LFSEAFSREAMGIRGTVCAIPIIAQDLVVPIGAFIWRDAVAVHLLYAGGEPLCRDTLCPVVVDVTMAIAQLVA
jgi:hypothetical protein